MNFKMPSGSIKTRSLCTGSGRLKIIKHEQTSQRTIDVAHEFQTQFSRFTDGAMRKAIVSGIIFKGVFMIFIFSVMLSLPAISDATIKRTIFNFCERHLVAFDPSDFSEEAKDMGYVALLKRTILLQEKVLTLSERERDVGLSWKEMESLSKAKTMLSAMTAELLERESKLINQGVK